MANTFAILISGQEATDLETKISELEIEENVDMAGAFSISLPLNHTSAGDYDLVNDTRLAPLSNLCVTAAARDGKTQCLIDGYVLSQTVHLDTGTAKSTVKVWGQDATWLMNTTEQVKEWVDVSDGQAANAIFANYGMTADDNNLSDDSPTHTEDGHSLMQRATDAQFLRRLARRNGKLFRVYCTDTPGERTGSFAKPSLAGDPVTVLTLNDATAATVDSVDLTWDVMRPTATIARQALFTDDDQDGAGGTTSDSGLDPLEARDLATFAGTTVTSLLTTTVDDGDELTERAQSVLREASWFVRCQGTADANRLGSIMRAGTVARLDTAGSLHSGKYFVWSVRHKITPDRHTMDFVLVRNAVGSAPGSGGLAGAIGL
ncbi:MAG TPA: contractile injection system protein, VgrG/Pvc8 family [Candidatus Angelobacter sp.]|jgi:phage protein D|nr:contractile injection system protein, VgrG/Pvc8 family [Candidatus Angelobacter sp.]